MFNSPRLASNGPVILPPRLLRASLAALLTVAVVTHAAAQVGVRPADQWIAVLESSERIESMRVPELISRLGVQKEMVIADVGAGSGVLTGPLALATGPRGTVYASDIDQALLTHIEQRAQSSRLGNVKTVLGSFTDPKLPAPVDLALMNDVLHHVADRAAYLKTLASQIKRGGRLAIVDYKPESSPHKDKPELIVAEGQVNDWAALAGLERTESFSLYTDRYFLIYTKK
jgi:2-polyprenyl-3-methyl-5-hydroxy-6-metoxy-1,4-benzoquinol methylase